jgi:fatty acid desaturase
MEVNENRSFVYFTLMCMLTILLIALKVTKVIFWSWWWIIAPLWIPQVAIITVLLIVLIGSKLHKTN